MKWVAVLVFLVGCAWPTKTEPWCLPKAKYKRDKEEVYVGIRCDW